MIGTELAEPLCQCCVHLLRIEHRRLALRRRAHELDRILLGKAEIDEEFPVIHLDGEILGLHRRLERQREMQREDRLLGIEVEIIAGGRLIEFERLAVRFAIGEEVVFLERGDVDLGERRQLLAGELTLLFRLDALGGEHRKHVVERPGMMHAGHRAVRRIDELALHRDPDVRMRGCRTGKRKTGDDNQKRGDETMHEKIATLRAKPAARYHGLRRNGGTLQRNKVTENLHACRAAVGARIVRRFQGSVRMQHHRAGMAHEIGIGVRQ